MHINVALQELSKDLGLFVFYSQVGMLKAIRRHIACPKGLTQLLLTFLSSYSQAYMEKALTGFISPHLWGTKPAQEFFRVFV